MRKDLMRDIESLIESRVREIGLYDLDRGGKDNLPPLREGEEVFVAKRYEDESYFPTWEVVYYPEGDGVIVTFLVRFSYDAEYLHQIPGRDCLISPDEDGRDIELEIFF